MSEPADQNIIDLITEFAKSSNTEIDVESVQEAFPEFQMDQPEVVGLDGLNNHPLGDIASKRIGELESQLTELKKAIVENKTLLVDLKNNPSAQTPAVDEALFEQRINTLQRKVANLNFKIQKTNEKVIVQEQPVKRNNRWLWLSLLINSILGLILIFFLWNYFFKATPIKQNKSEANKVNQSNKQLKIVTPKAPILNEKTLAAPEINLKKQQDNGSNKNADSATNVRLIKAETNMGNNRIGGGATKEETIKANEKDKQSTQKVVAQPLRKQTPKSKVKRIRAVKPAVRKPKAKIKKQVQRSKVNTKPHSIPKKQPAVIFR